MEGGGLAFYLAFVHTCRSTATSALAMPPLPVAIQGRLASLVPGARAEQAGAGGSSSTKDKYHG
jgi:hypothetical protein